MSGPGVTPGNTPPPNGFQGLATDKCSGEGAGGGPGAPKIVKNCFFGRFFQNFPNASDCIRTHPGASQRIRTHPNRCRQVPASPKTSKKLKKLAKIREKISRKFSRRLVFGRSLAYSDVFGRLSLFEFHGVVSVFGFDPGQLESSAQ